MSHTQPAHPAKSQVTDHVSSSEAVQAVFRERVIAPRAPRLGADTPADALAICLDARGEPRLAVDLPGMSDFCADVDARMVQVNSLR